MCVRQSYVPADTNSIEIHLDSAPGTICFPLRYAPIPFLIFAACKYTIRILGLRYRRAFLCFRRLSNACSAILPF